jgi:integrase
MRGTVRRHGKGWQILYRVDGKQLNASGFATKGEAEAELVTRLAALETGMHVNPNKITVNEYLNDVWLPAVKNTVKPTTLASYTMQVKQHLVPNIGKVRLQKLTAAHINAMYAILSESGKIVREAKKKDDDSDDGKPLSDASETPTPVPQGLSSNSVGRAHAALHRALNDAVRWGYVLRNVSDMADPPRIVKLREMAIWSPAQLRTFADTARGERLYAMWLLFVTTGMRRGEVCGLRWVDVDIDGARVSVRQIRVPLGNKVMVGEPKTATSRRTLPLDPATLAALKVWKKQQVAERLHWGEAWTDTGWVFTKESGLPYYPQSITTMFYKLTTKAKLPRIRLHEVRHSWATAALQAGINPKIVSERLGHAGVAITLDVYSSVTASMSEDAAVRVAALILGEC